MIQHALQRAKHHFGVVRTSATKRVVKGFAQTHQLVYFGTVSQYDDEHQLVRGVTLSKNHHDRHYCVGSIHEYDMILLQRTDEVTYPGKPSDSYTWMIMQFDLNASAKGLPHVFIDAHRHGEAFYANLSVKFSNLRVLDASHFVGHDDMFVNTHRVYTAPSDIQDAARILTPEVTGTIAQHFKYFDFEILHDSVLVYYSNAIASRQQLDNMVRAGLWLARHLDSQER